MSPPKRLPKIGFVLLAMIAFFWGVGWPMMKIALSEIGPWTFRSFCLVFGGLGVFAIAKANRSWSAIPRNEFRHLLIVAFFNVTGWQLASAYGLSYMHAGRAAIVGHTMPVWASLFAVILLKEKMNLSRVIGLGFGLAGLAVLLGGDFRVLGAAPLGAALMLMAAMSNAAGIVFLKYFRWTISTFNLTGWQLLLGGIPVVLGTLLLEPFSGLSGLSLRAALATAFMVFVCGILCTWAWFRVVQLFPAGVAAIGTLAVPVVGVLSSAVILGEPIGFHEVVALLLLIAAVSTVMLKPEGFFRNSGAAGSSS